MPSMKMTKHYGQGALAFIFGMDCEKTNIISSLKKVDYQIMYLPLKKESNETDEELLQSIDKLYRVLYPKPLHDEYFDYLSLV